MSRARTAAPPPGAPERQRSRHGGRDSRRDSPGSREWQILAVVLVGAFMAVLDTTIINVALPSIVLGLHARPADLEWVVSVYARRGAGHAWAPACSPELRSPCGRSASPARAGSR